MNENLNFAMTFSPAKELIINLMRVADGEERDEKEICEFTAMPGGESSGKLRPQLDYAQSMGLLQYTYAKKKYIISKTSLGEKIYDEDFSLDEDMTLELLNYNMSSSTNGTLVWNLLVRKLLSSKVTSYSTIYNYFEAKYEKDEKSARRIVTPYKSSQNGFFEQIGFLNDEQDGLRIRPLKINKRYVFMYAYTLFSDWDILFGKESELPFSQISDDIQWGQGFGWNDEETFRALQLCEDYGLIRINKQLVPMTIVKNISKDETLRKLFELL